MQNESPYYLDKVRQTLLLELLHEFSFLMGVAAPERRLLPVHLRRRPIVCCASVSKTILSQGKLVKQIKMMERFAIISPSSYATGFICYRATSSALVSGASWECFWWKTKRKAPLAFVEPFHLARSKSLLRTARQL